MGLVLFSNTISANWYEQFSLKVTMETEELLYEWEYENPNSFEFEKGNEIIRGEEAKKSFDDILSVIDLTKPILGDETIEGLENMGYPPIQRLVVHRIDGENRYKVWSWPVH